MSLIDKIKNAQLVARRNKLASAPLLTTIIGEAEMVGKNAGNRPPSDDEVVKILKKFYEGLQENIKYLVAARDKNPSVIDEILQSKLNHAYLEISVVEMFLPQKLEDATVYLDITNIMYEQALPKEMKSMGIITKSLKEKYGTQFDGAQVSKLFKEFIS